jgi:hypothetical protein
MKQFLVCALLAGMLLVPASVAQAKWERGYYSGKTADGAATASFEAGRRAVKSFAFNKLKITCSDGIVRVSSQRDFVPMRVNATTGKFQGKSPGFAERLTVPVAFGIGVQGTLENGRARGKLHVFYRMSPEGSLSPTGSITCDSGPRSWRARTF